MLLGIILLFSFLGSAGAILCAAVILAFRIESHRRLVPILVSYATGTLIGAVFLGLLPKALSLAPAPQVLRVVLVGLIFFFLLEKALIWRHCHCNACPIHDQTAWMILVGDAFHNFVDGILIAGAFLTSPSLGIVTSIAVIAHEIPQEVGDFAILLSQGFSRRRAFIGNMLSGITTLAGALLTYLAAPKIAGFLPFLMALAASSFLYIALADLIPAHHRQAASFWENVIHFALLCGGIFTIAVL